MSAEHEQMSYVLTQFENLSDKFLESATQQTSVWKRSIFGIPQQEAILLNKALLNSDLAEFLHHINPATNETYQVDNPQYGYIVAEEFDYRETADEKGAGSFRELEVGFHYQYSHPDPEGDYYDVRITLRVGSPQLTSYVFATEYAETGYEGHDWKTKEGNLSQLQRLYGLMKRYGEGKKSIDTPIMNQIAHFKMIDDLTGDEYFYDPERNEWFTREGRNIGDMEELWTEVLEVVGTEQPLVQTGTYRIEIIEDNPFLKETD